ncbi:CHL4-domain-containing protein [Terfezia boudieri ATCC MYA-4762]|uniref:CHL4-domain-containing protein n=1 Tax=Terfezia boudieri ATCC MYA-4762 TaxID=1051890 RepID=A0A3N4M3V9_9PEZI|nr:CHL4-domain-containing protein [Terfezia boudieri ATCC MYA-4762]
MPKQSSANDRSLSDAQLIPHSSNIQKLLLKPSKTTLCEIAIDWLDNSQLGTPHPPPEGFGDDDEDRAGEQSVEDLKGVYEKMKAASSVTRKAVIERIVERDWNQGLNLWQIAQLECRCIADNAIVHKWTAGRLLLQGLADSEAALPRFQASSFVYNLQTIIKPMIRSHCHIFKYTELSLVIIRIQLHEAAGDVQAYAELPPSKRVIFCAFPENTPFIFWNTGVKDPLRAILLDSLAPAMSRPGQRFELKSTSLTAKSLSTMVHMRSSTRSSHALGAWSLYADDKIDKSPLDSGFDAMSGGNEGEDKESEDTMAEAERARSKRRKIAGGRFGTSGVDGDGRGIEKLEVTIRDKMPVLSGEGEAEDGNRSFRPTVTVTFEGSHVFAGIRKMVEVGLIDGLAMPSWMTGEDGVNVAVVKDRSVLKRADRWY